MLKSFSEKKILFLVYGAFLFVPIKLSFSLVFILPLILIYLLRDFKFNDLFKDEYKYLTYFFIFAFLSSFCALYPFKSIFSLCSFYFYFLLIPAVIRYTPRDKVINLISLLVLGQTISSIHTIIQEALGENVVGEFFVGKLSESGQLALTLAVIMGFLFINKKGVKFKDFIFSITLFIESVCLGFSYLYFKEYTVILLVAFLVLISFSIFNVIKTKDFSNITNYILLYMPICLSSFILNLKRGPWIGCSFALLILILKYNRKIFLPILASSLVLIFSITPIRERVLSSESHFFISGGRASIWKVAGELTTRYPLGVGYKNSRNLSSYSVDIPSNLNHFHNNILNIIVEFGIFNLFLYLMWLILILKKSFKGNNLTFILGLAIISNQLAGLVEYNIGDTEVLFILLLFAGLIEVLTKKSSVF